MSSYVLEDVCVQVVSNGSKSCDNIVRCKECFTNQDLVMGIMAIKGNKK